MSAILTATAVISGFAATALSAGLLSSKARRSRADALLELLEGDFKPTHQHPDAKGRYLLAFDVKTARVFVAERGKNAMEPQCLPASQLESVNIVEVGEKRITELRIDILFADDRRTLVRIHFLRSAVSLSSPELEQARTLAHLWDTRLKAHQADASSLRVAMAADVVPDDSGAPRWQTASAAGFASVSALAIAVSLLIPATAPDRPAMAASVPATMQPVSALAEIDNNTGSDDVTDSVKKSRPSESDLVSLLAPFAQRIDDISEQSLVHTRRTSTNNVRAVLDALDSIASDLLLAQVMVDSKEDQQRVEKTRLHFVATLQDVLPRYRRLYTTALLQDADLSLQAQAGGYASRDLVLTNRSFKDEITRNAFVETIADDLDRLRFDTVRIRASGNGEYLEVHDLDNPDDSVLAAALPTASTNKLVD